MLKVENVEVLGWEHAIRGMRNPKNSWAKSDSGPECPYGKEKCCGECQQNFCIGPNDKQLMMALRNAGTDHRKFMRMITVYLDITAPLYWWKDGSCMCDTDAIVFIPNMTGFVYGINVSRSG